LLSFSLYLFLCWSLFLFLFSFSFSLSLVQSLERTRPLFTSLFSCLSFSFSLSSFLFARRSPSPSFSRFLCFSHALLFLCLSRLYLFLFLCVCPTRVSSLSCLHLLSLPPPLALSPSLAPPLSPNMHTVTHTHCSYKDNLKIRILHSNIDCKT